MKFFLIIALFVYSVLFEIRPLAIAKKKRELIVFVLIAATGLIVLTLNAFEIFLPSPYKPLFDFIQTKL